MILDPDKPLAIHINFPLTQAVSIIQAPDDDCMKSVFLSDALSVPQASQNSRLLSLSRALYTRLLEPRFKIIIFSEK